MEYVYKTDPFAHQDRLFHETKDLPSHAIFWEQGTGKTKVTIDIAGYQFEDGLIDGILLIAPGGVHQNWTDQEIPRHMPDRILENSVLYTYHTVRAKQKREILKLEELIKFGGLSILAMTYDSVMTAHGNKFVRRFLTRRSTFMILDESHRIKSPDAKRTKRVLSLGTYARTKRILTGTPLANSPFDIYTPVKFLHPNFWKERNIPKFGVFKTAFGVWVSNETRDGDSYNTCVGYKNLEELYEYIQLISDRVTKEQVLPHLPERIYSQFDVELSSEQQKLYNAVRDEFIAFLDDGDTVTADRAMTRMLRLQQIVCGYVPIDGPEPDVWIAKDNPRMTALIDMLEDKKTPTIVYARFRRDIDSICDALGNRCVRYDGKIPIPDRPRMKEAFQAGDVQYFVGNPAVCGEGIDLYAGRTAIYYSNSFKLVDRLQSEARPHRQGQRNAVTYIDFVASGTIDEHILKSLRNKLDVSDIVLGDEFRSRL